MTHTIKARGRFRRTYGIFDEAGNKVAEALSYKRSKDFGVQIPGVYFRPDGTPTRVGGRVGWPVKKLRDVPQFVADTMAKIKEIDKKEAEAMKYIWEPKDIKFGRYITKADDNDTVSSMASQTYKIGYVMHNGDQRVALIAVTDGAAMAYENRLDLCNRINASEYRPIHTSKLIQVIEHLAAQNEGRD